MSNSSATKFRLLLIFLVVCLMSSGPAVNAENLTMTFDAPAYRIVEAGNSQHTIKMDGFNHLLTPGTPMLPVKTYMIALPPGAMVTSVEITGSGSVAVDGSYRIAAAPPAMQLGGDEALNQRCREEWQQSYDAVYSSDDAYPAEVGVNRGAGGLRKYTFVRVSYTPFSYQPVSGRLKLTPSMTVSINYNLPDADDPVIRKSLRDTKADKQASEFFVNYDQARPWYTLSEAMATYDEVYSYVIIYADGLLPTAEAYRAGHPISDEIALESVSFIEANYSGLDLQEKIRNYLTEKYLDWGLQWVLLLGDIDEIPMRKTYPDPEDHWPHSTNSPPTDFYYSDLTYTWDEDGDGYYGEYGEDMCDFAAELHVGRIPYNDPLTVGSILNKILAFQYDTGDWKNNALLLGAILNYADQFHIYGMERTDGADLMEMMMADFMGGLNCFTEYEKEGLNPSVYPCDLPINYSNLVGEWAGSDYGIVAWNCHGNDTYLHRKWWSWDDGDNIMEDGEMVTDTMLDVPDAPTLDNDHPSLVFAMSCDTGWPEWDNLAKNLLKNGAAGIVASTRSHWYSPGWVSLDDGLGNTTQYLYYQFLVGAGQRVGEALSSAKLEQFNNYWVYDGKYEACNMYCLCLYGDPYTLREGEEGSGSSYVCGDANGDGNVTHADVMFLIEYLHKGGPAPDPIEAGDANGDGVIDKLDCKYLIEYLHKDGPEPVCP